MTEAIGNWITAILTWMEVIPIEGWAILAGIFIGTVATQWLKRTFPLNVLFPKAPKHVLVLGIRITAFLFSFLPTFFIWPGQHAIWAALAVGFASPSIYRIGSYLVYQRWPHLAARFSGTE